MMKLKYFTLAIFLTIFSPAFSQKGKDGAKTVSIANSKINEFTALTANASMGNTAITVAASSLNANGRFSTSLVAGDLLMVVQMQGAFTKLYGYAVPWQPDSTYGYIWNYATCGNYEFAEVKSVVSSTQIELTCGLNYAYSSAGKTQVVRVPRYSSLTVTSTGTLTTDAWNGTIGGVLIAEIESNTIVDGVISANALGFRGGFAVGNGGSGNGNFVTRNPNDGAAKGEGIGSDRLSNTAPNDTLGVQCKGAPGNGGGGGNANNCGGGGGGNGGIIVNYNGYGIPDLGSAGAFTGIWNLEWPGRASVTSSGGGKGGYGTSTTTTVNLNVVGPNNAAWSSFKRPSYGGFGGRPLDYSTGKIFMGGGGGAGHMTANQSNGAGACSGGAGGGLIYILNYGTMSGSGTISSNGANGGAAYGTGAAVRGIDGAGGAGAGGTIILKSNGTISGITTNANGGNGGNQNINFPLSTNEGQGPGGGGSGGYIAGNGSVFTQNVNGGTNGITNARAFDTEFPMNGATSGDVGTNNQVIAPAFSLTASANQTLCTNQSATLTATSTDGSATVLWYNGAAGGNSVASGTVYTTPTYTATGTYTVYAGSCPGLYRVPIIITVGSGATITVNSPTICPGQTVTLTANGATTYTWNTGPTTNTISVSPASTTIYTVNATSGTCVGTQTTQVQVSPTPTVSVASTTICTGNSSTLTANGATNYTWMPGGQTTSSIVVTPTTNTTYTITGANGTCTNSTSASVNVTTTPTLSTSSKTICAGQVATFTVSGATSYTWNPGNTTGSTYTTSPASSGTISVIGANGTCTSQVATSITVTPNPTVAVSNQTICSGQTVILTATGATTYSWNTGPTTNTISVSPTSLTIYTVVGTTNLCTNTRTLSVTVSTQPTVAVANASICSGNSTILTATGATNYTWMPGGQLTNTVSVSPGSTTIYTITGATGTCTNSTNAAVNVTSTPTLVANSATICPGQTATLTVSGATNYTWNPGTVTGTTYTISPASNTTISVIGANGTCTTSATLSVTIGTGISISVNNPTICVGQTALLTANGATSYTWDSGANTNTINVSPASTITYTVSGMSGACSGSNTAVVTVMSAPSVSVTSATICAGTSATLTASGASNYTWAPNGQTTANISESPTSTASYTVIGANGTCTNSAVTTISVNTTPTLTVNSLTICTGQTATLSATGATSYTWNPGNISGNTFTISPLSNTVITIDGANGTCTSQTNSSITIGSGISLSVNNATICSGQTATLAANGATSYTWNTTATSSSISVSPTSTTIYTVDGSNGSCSGTNTATVVVNSTPTLAIINSPNICSGQTATLTASGANTYTWTTLETTSSITVSPTSTTIYTVAGTDVNGCVSSTESTTLGVSATPSITINSASICVGQTATLIASGATSYTWSTTETTSSISVNPITNTTYSVSGDNGGCTSNQTATVSLTPSPTVTVSSPLFTGCSPFCTNFTDIVSASSTDIVYDFGDGNTANTNNPSHCFLTGGNYTVTATVTNSVLGCSSTYTLPAIDVFTTPIADFNITEGNTVPVGTLVNFVNTSTNADTYLWNISCNGASLTSENFSATFVDTGNCCINLISTAVSGCNDTVRKCINIVKEAVVIIPNVFTPNGDGNNEVFKINSSGLKTLNCAIFDRWGLKMYEWDGINGYWDGNAKSGPAPDGTYFYIINYTDQLDKTTTEKGFLNLFKN
jgi:gliding motility-associated-like protein